MKRSVLMAAVCVWLPSDASASDCSRDAPPPLFHSHNDYQRERPLFDALEHGFDSVEADVHLRGKDLLVAHDSKDVKPGRTLQSLYLEPLRAMAEANGGWIRDRAKEFVLLVDIKSEAETSYRALKRLLARYDDILTAYEGGERRPGAVTVIVSGNRPKHTIAAETHRQVALDGDEADLDSYAPAALIPWISLEWGRLEQPVRIGTTGNGAVLEAAAAQAHARGRKLRIWGGRDTESGWALLYKGNVDIMHTDHLFRIKRLLGQCVSGNETEEAPPLSRPTPSRAR